MDQQFDVYPVQSNERVPFRCTLCGKCCRHVTQKVMVESLDAYRIARYLRSQGEPDVGIADVYARYTTPTPLVMGYPVYTVNTVGEEHACVFLKDGRCSIYPARPRTCRLYPFTANIGQRGQDFKWYLCLDNFDHLTGGQVLVKEWFYQNFTKEDKEFVKREADALPSLGTILGRLGKIGYQCALALILFYKYRNFDLEKPFLPQYDRNQQELMNQLSELVGR